MKTLVLLATLLSINFAISQELNNNNQLLDSVNFNTIYPYALRGEMETVFKLLDSTDNTLLSEKQRSIKQKYYDRFLTRSEKFDYHTDNLLMIHLFKKFQNYWRSVLIEKIDQKLADELFVNEMVAFLKKEFKPKQSVADIKQNYFELFLNFFESLGFHGLAMGKTGHLYDLYLWKEEKEVIYNIALPETNIKVPVVFMKDFISNGWSHYTTFGRSYSGGWAFPDKLYCVEESYDLNSENFKISYVTHEGQHFADMKLYPKLKQADLEYRAKLTELSLAKNSIPDLIEKFSSHAKNDKSNAHAYANYLVIKRMSQAIFNAPAEQDIEQWKSINLKKINKTAHGLLIKHTIQLNKKGATTVESCIL